MSWWVMKFLSLETEGLGLGHFEMDDGGEILELCVSVHVCVCP